MWALQQSSSFLSSCVAFFSLSPFTSCYLLPAPGQHLHHHQGGPGGLRWQHKNGVNIQSDMMKWRKIRLNTSSKDALTPRFSLAVFMSHLPWFDHWICWSLLGGSIMGQWGESRKVQSWPIRSKEFVKQQLSFDGFCSPWLMMVHGERSNGGWKVQTRWELEGSHCHEKLDSRMSFSGSRVCCLFECRVYSGWLCMMMTGDAAIAQSGSTTQSSSRPAASRAPEPSTASRAPCPDQATRSPVCLLRRPQIIADQRPVMTPDPRLVYIDCIEIQNWHGP